MLRTAPAAGPERAAAPVTWEEPDCPLCGGKQRRAVLEAPDPHPGGPGLWFAVVECGDCGLHYTCPRPDEASIAAFYPMDYRPHRSRGREFARPNAPLAWLRGRPCVERRTLPWHGHGRLLDFGCGGGSFLDRMHRQGWSVTGVDVAPAAIEMVKSAVGVRALQGTLPHPDLEPASFDVITMWHSLEHAHRPLSVLRAARQLLAPSGKLLIAVPNLAGWPFRWFGPSWFGLDLPRHLCHFTPTTLKLMLAEAGFPGAAVRMIRHSDWLRSSAKLACARPHVTAWQRGLTLKPLARLAAWSCYLFGRSDCMLATAQVG